MAIHKNRTIWSAVESFFYLLTFNEYKKRHFEHSVSTKFFSCSKNGYSHCFRYLKIDHADKPGICTPTIEKQRKVK